MALTPVSNTAAGAIGAIPLAPGGYGTPTQPFLLLGQGSFTANGASAVTVADAGCTALSQYIFTPGTVAGTPAGQPFVATITPGTGFTVKAVAGDTSVYNFLRIG